MNKTYCPNCEKLWDDTDLVPYLSESLKWGDEERCPQCDEFDELMTEAEYQQLEREEQ